MNDDLNYYTKENSLKNISPKRKKIAQKNFLPSKVAKKKTSINFPERKTIFEK